MRRALGWIGAAATWVVDEACGSASTAYAPPPGTVQCERAAPGVSEGPDGETWRVRASSLAFSPSFAGVTVDAVRRAFRDAMMIPPGGAGLVPRPGRVAILRTADGVYARGAAPGTYAFIPDPTKLSTFPRALTLPVGLRCP